jgi:hypothetical protein
MPTLALESLDGDAVVPVVGGHLSDALRHRFPTRFHRRLPGEAGNATALGEHIVGPDHHLRWNTAVVGTFAPDQVALDADDMQAALGKRIGKLLAANAQAEDDHVDALRHLA